MRRLALCCAVVVLGGACGSTYDDADWTLGTPRIYAGRGPFSVRWRADLAPDIGGAFLPVESAVPALDPVGNRVFVGSSEGALWALRSDGLRLWRYDARGAVGSAPVVDARADQIFVGTGEGIVHALVASDGRHRWHVPVGGPVAGMALSQDAVYAVTEDDVVVALSRASGEELWRFKHDAPPGLCVVGHAGLVLDDGTLYTGFSDGTISALDAADGGARWERDTSLDLPDDDESSNFLDVDTTPILRGDAVWAASTSAGLYVLSRSSGNVLFHDGARTGIVAMARAGGDALLLGTGEALVLLDAETHVARWSKPLRRGAATQPIVAGPLVLYGESRGGLVELSLADGSELGRIESGHGFASSPVAAGHLAFALSNGGALYALGI